MVLSVRLFQSTPGQDRELIDSLRHAAAKIIQGGNAQSILICQQKDDPSQIIWLESRSRTSGPLRPGVTDRPSQFSGGALRDVSNPKPLEFLDGFYRFPLPPCRLWKLDILTAAGRESSAVEELLRSLRAAFEGSRVIGTSLYRVSDEPGLLLGFLALPQRAGPLAGVGRPIEWPLAVSALVHRLVWHPISVIGTLGRLSAEGTPLLSPTRYPRTAFWARPGVFSHRITPVDADEAGSRA